MDKNILTLECGTLKNWDFKNSEKGKKLLKEYFEICSFSNPMATKETSRQKEIICELIDLCDDDTIYLEYNNKFLSKKNAKEYILNYCIWRSLEYIKFNL